jgi:ribosomal protein S18 acetylase RimI-like enzyme
MPITIRPFEPQDYPDLLDIYSRAAPLGVYSPEVEASNSRTYVAVEQDTSEVVGFAVVPIKEWYSFDLVVSPPWQRQGIGRLFWERLSQDLVGIGATAVEPWVREENAAGIGWLLKHGFAPTRLDGPVSLFLKGVLPEYRRHGIATALKIKTITYARERGFHRLLTNSDNPAMQALNKKLGFHSGSWRVYRKALT